MSGAKLAENRVERSGSMERACQRTMERERSTEREVSERKRGGERDESAAHSSLQPNISLTS